MAGIERKVTSSPMLIGGMAMTTNCEEEELVAGQSSARANEAATPKFNRNILTKIFVMRQPRRTRKEEMRCAKRYH